jgi:hypothetical protein
MQSAPPASRRGESLLEGSIMMARFWMVVAVSLTALAGSVYGQAQPSPPGILASRLRWVQFEIVGGRIIASSIHAGANMNSSNNSGNRREKISIDLTGASPNIHYELADKTTEITLDVKDGDEFSIRSQKKVGETTQAVEFTQTPREEITLTIEDQTGKHTKTAPTLWHLLLDDPEVTQNTLAPTLELLKPGWRLATLAAAVEEALCQNARLRRSDDRTRWEGWVRELSGAHFADRLEAERKLLGAGREILPFLHGLDRTALDAEQWRRVRNVIEALDNSKTDSVEQTVSLLVGDPRAWLLLLSRNDESKRCLAKTQIESLLGSSIEFTPDAAPEIRQQQIEKLRERFAPPPPAEETRG